MKEYLKKTAEQIDIKLSSDQLEKFQIYYDFLIEKNKVMNLTTITDEKEVVIKHFIDSISICSYFDFLQDEKKVVDVGTGAGFPGIPLAILFPKVKFTLMDSLNKRINFLNEVCEKCKLDNVTCIHSRAEEMGKNVLYREKYDVCVSRAVANLSVLLEYCIPLVKNGGHFIAYKSLLADDELKNIKKAEKELKCHLETKKIFQLPNSDYERCFLCFHKDNKLSQKYPRQNGIPRKKPL